MKLVDGQSKNINGGSRLKAELTEDSQTKKLNTRIVYIVSCKSGGVVTKAKNYKRVHKYTHTLGCVYMHIH